MSFSIHQFSSGIINPQQNKEGKWVSGGDNGEIDKKSHDVPKEIKDAVNTKSKGGWRGFGIPDAYHPEMNEFALIARELKDYCVLAVANPQKDDADRPYIAYRYFWLDKRKFQNQPDFDGIATLLSHWREKGSPQYDIGEWKNSSDLYTNSWDIQEKLISRKDQFFEQHLTRILPLIPSINSNNQSLDYNKPVIYFKGGKNYDVLQPEEVHCLAIQYSHVKSSINWAWNVRSLESMKDWRVIYSADAKAANWFNQQSSEGGYIPNEPGGNIVKTPVSHSNTQNLKTKKIRAFLLKFRGKFSEEDVLALMNYYQEYRQNIVQFQDKNTINSFFSEMPDPSAQKIKYATLLTALAPDENKGILSELMKLNSKLKNEVAINFLDELLLKATIYSNCFNHPIYKSFHKKITDTRSQLTSSLKNNLPVHKKFLPRISFPRELFPFKIFFFLLVLGCVGVAWRYWPNILNTISTINKYVNLSVKSPPISIRKPVSLPEQLNKYDNQYEAFKIVEQKGIKELKNKLDQDNKEIYNKLAEAEQHIRDLSGNYQQVINARKQQTYTIFEQLTPIINKDNLPELKQEEQQDEYYVTFLQEVLDRFGSYDQKNNYEPGKFGESTKKAVEKLQGGRIETLRKQSKPITMTKDGIVGPDTWNLLVPRLKDLQVEKVYETLKNHLKPENETDYNIVSEIKKCQDNNQNGNALKFLSCLEELNNKLNDEP